MAVLRAALLEPQDIESPTAFSLHQSLVLHLNDPNSPLKEFVSQHGLVLLLVAALSSCDLEEINQIRVGGGGLFVCVSVFFVVWLLFFLFANFTYVYVFVCVYVICACVCKSNWRGGGGLQLHNYFFVPLKINYFLSHIVQFYPFLPLRFNRQTSIST